MLKVTTGGVPPGTYMHCDFKGHEVSQNQFGPALVWRWAIGEGDHAGKTATRWTDARPTLRNKTGEIVASLTKQNLSDGLEVDPDLFIGKKYTIIVAKAKGGGTRVETCVAEW